MKQFSIHCATTLTALLCGACYASAADNSLVAYWNFDGADNQVAREKVSGSEDNITGYARHVKGVRGSALIFDGFTSYVTHKADGSMNLAKGFTVEAWIAPQEYSWNWTGFVDQEMDHREGFSFGINHIGQVGLGVAIDGEWHTLISKESIPLLKWSHVAASFDPAGGMTVYIDGQTAGSATIKGDPTPSQADLWIGMSHTRQWPALTEREASKTPTLMVFDGLIDEVRVYGKALDTEAVMASSKAIVPKNPQPLQYRKMPSGPNGCGPFGAYYTRLSYCEEWDRLWRVSDHPDIVVRFDESPTKIVFWRGTSYIPAWVSENGRWVSDQGPEIFNEACYEVMSDKHCQNSHVRIVENSPARVLVHWRTALPNPRMEFTNVDPQTGWGPWADDYYYIYPDGVCVRYQRAWGPHIHEFQQSEVLCQPGTKPQDNLELNAITVMDLNGDSNTFSWEKAYGVRLPVEKQVNGPIQITNLKSENRHYVIGESGSYWKPFIFGALEGYSTMPNWNHWPVAQLPNDGRVAPAPDRPSSTCLGTLYPIRHKDEGVKEWVRNLYGMTDEDPKRLAALARSWNNPPELELKDGTFTCQGYDKSQRAYLLTYTGNERRGTLAFEIQASEESPVVNIALVVEDWGDDDVRLTLNDQPVPQGQAFRVGYRRGLESVDLIVWITVESLEPLKVSMGSE